MVVGRIYFFVDLGTEGLRSLLGVGQGPPLALCHVYLSAWHLSTWQLASIRTSKREQRKAGQKSLSRCNPTSEVAPHHFSTFSSLEASPCGGKGVAHMDANQKVRAVAANHRCTNRGREMVNNSPEVTQLVSGRVRV